MSKYWGKHIFCLGSSKAKDVLEKEKRVKVDKVGNNNGQLCIANATSGGAGKSPGPRLSKY